MRGGWTLIELVVAAGLLVAVMALGAAVLRSAADVTGAGRAAADVLAEIAVIERRMRSDFERISREGFLAVRCVAVPNDVNGVDALIDPALPPGAIVRADQIVFFVQGLASMQTFRGGAGADHRGQSTVSRVYWGHAYQAPRAGPVEVPPADERVVLALDPADGLVPWHRGRARFVRSRFQDNATDPPGDYVVRGGPVSLDATQPRADRWLAVRQALILADDGGSPNVLFFRIGKGGQRSTASITDAGVRNGRVDAAASLLNDIRLDLRAGRLAAADALFYPRAERAAPGMHRVDQALTAHVIAGGCSAIMIEWTFDGDAWEPGPVAQWGGATLHGAAVTEAAFGCDDSPWPVLFRVSLTLCDPRGRSPLRRTVQLVLEVPER